MGGRIAYSVLGIFAFVIAAASAADPPEHAPQLGLVLALVGVGFMLAAGAFSLGEVARSRQVMLAPQPPAPPPPTQPTYQGQQYQGQPYPSPSSGQPYQSQGYGSYQPPAGQ
jgi:hypothetical protein